MSWRYPCLRFDPVPGDPDEVGRLGRDTRRIVAEVAQLAAKLRRLGQAGAHWQGEAAQGFAALVGDLPASCIPPRRPSG